MFLTDTVPSFSEWEFFGAAAAKAYDLQGIRHKINMIHGPACLKHKHPSPFINPEGTVARYTTSEPSSNHSDRSLETCPQDPEKAEAKCLQSPRLYHGPDKNSPIALLGTNRWTRVMSGRSLDRRCKCITAAHCERSQKREIHSKGNKNLEIW